jgi:hypothetical protein
LFTGCRYDEGSGVAKDPVVAANFYRLAADQGLADAQCNLGGLAPLLETLCRIHFRGLITYLHAVGTSVGISYAKGEGVAKDPVEAARLYALAAAQGHVDAQRNLGSYDFFD